MIRSIYLPITLCALAIIGACATQSRQERQNAERKIHKLVLQNMKFRRPAGPGADPKAGPGGTDYKSDPLPTSFFDCKPMPVLFSAFNPGIVRNCVASIDSGTFNYRLRRGPQPLLELQDPEDAPECLRNSLKEIPVPREIFFQSIEAMPDPYLEDMPEKDRRKYLSGTLNCYSSRLDLEANELMGARLPGYRLNVKIAFPLDRVPENDEDTIRLLLTWAIAPFWDEDGIVHAKIVTDAVCDRCLGEKNVMHNSDPPPVLWP